MSALPKALPLQMENIPAELIKIPQWVCWKFKPAKGKYTKTPINPKTGQLASTTSRRTWGTFEEALAGMGKYGLPGVGFVFSEDDPYCGIDLDDCVHLVSGRVDTWAQEIADEIDSYTEISPSGTGIKIFTRASLPLEGRRRSGNVEMYDYARFFTVTGHQLAGSRDVIANRIKAVNHLHKRLFPAGQESDAVPVRITALSDFNDQELIERASAASNGQKFLRLYQGDTSGYDSQSEADLALCSLIAFWAGPDEAQIDRVFRQSGLYRDKWEREGYRTSTITAALDRTEFWEPESNTTIDLQSLLQTVSTPDTGVDMEEARHPYIINVADLLKEPDEPDLFLCEGLIRATSLGLTVGPPKTFKSFLEQELHIAIATGTPAFGTFPTGDPQVTVYVQEESSRGALRRRFRSLLNGRDIHPAAISETLYTVTNQGVEMDDPDSVRRFIDEVMRIYQPTFITFDPLREIHSQDENSSKDMRPILKLFKQMREEFEVSIQLVHHNNKNPLYDNPADSIRGTTSIWGAMDGALFVGKTDNKDVMLVTPQLKEGGQADAFLYSIQEDGEALVLKSIDKPGADVFSVAEIVAWARAQGDWWGVERAIELLPVGESTIRRTVRQGVSTGALKEKKLKFGKKVYAHLEVDDDEPTF